VFSRFCLYASFLLLVGCVDFTCIDHYHLQLLTQTVQAFWLAIENGNSDSFIQDSLKYPLKGKLFSRNDVHTERRKNNLLNLRNDILLRKKANIFISFIIIGFASENEFTSVKVFDQFYRSIFDSVSIYSSRYVECLGMLLTSKGFLFGIEIQKSVLLAVVSLLQRVSQLSNGTSNSSNASNNPVSESENSGSSLPLSERLIAISKLLFTVSDLNLIINNSSIALELYASSVYAKLYSFSSSSHSNNTCNKISRFKIEFICFMCYLWDRIIWHCNGELKLMKEFKSYFMEAVISNLENIANADEINKLKGHLFDENDVMSINDSCNYILLTTARENGYIASNSFISKCAFIWETLNNHNIFILNGDDGIGKSSIRETVKKSIIKMNRILLTRSAVSATTTSDTSSSYSDRINYHVIHSLNWPVNIIISAKKILKVLRTWHAHLLHMRFIEAQAAKMEALYGNNNRKLYFCFFSLFSFCFPFSSFSQ
jgi:hypothetical protein